MHHCSLAFGYPGDYCESIPHPPSKAAQSGTWRGETKEKGVVGNCVALAPPPSRFPSTNSLVSTSFYRCVVILVDNCGILETCTPFFPHVLNLVRVPWLPKRIIVCVCHPVRNCTPLFQSVLSACPGALKSPSFFFTLSLYLS